MPTLKTVKGKHIVTYDGVEMEYESLTEALKVAYALYQLNK